MSSRTEAGAVGRRAFLRRAGRLALPTAAGLLVAGHTPFLQWKVYRKRHLLILGSKDDPAGYRLVVAIAETLARALPESKARPSRASNGRRLASLLATGQMDIAVLPPETARAIADGTPPIAQAGPVDLRLLLRLGAAHLLVARAAFPEDHAFLVVEALDHERLEDADVAVTLPDSDAPLPPHPGVLRYRAQREPF